MELVNVNLYAEGYYSESKYEDIIWIKKSSYEKLKDVFPTEISCGELDGKHSDVYGDITISDDWKTDEDYAKAGMSKYDGDYLEYALKQLYADNDLDYDAEQKEIEDYFNTLDVWKEITIRIPTSKIDEVIAIVDVIRGEKA